MVRLSTVGAFLKMLKTRYVAAMGHRHPKSTHSHLRRFGETLPMVENILRVTPFETSQRHMRTISEYATYKKVFQTLPAVLLSAQKVRVRNGEPGAIRDLWASKDKTFLALDFEWSERNNASCLEWGYAAVRCGHLDMSVRMFLDVAHHAEAVWTLSPCRAGAWPPDPEPNYR